MSMNVTYRDDGGIVVKAEGVLSPREVFELNEKIYASPEDVRKISYQLCDFSGVTDFEGSTQELAFIAKQDKSAAELNPNMLLVLVSGSDLSYGMLRMWQAFTEDSRVESKVCRSMEEAEEWLARRLQQGPGEEDE